MSRRIIPATCPAHRILVLKSVRNGDANGSGLAIQTHHTVVSWHEPCAVFLIENIPGPQIDIKVFAFVANGEVDSLVGLLFAGIGCV